MKLRNMNFWKLWCERCCLLLLCLVLIPIILHATPMPEFQVRSAVQTWVQQVTADARPDAIIERMESYVEAGEIVAYIAHLSGGGFCLCGADNLVLPVYLYSPSGTFEPDNPETRFILKEIGARTKALIRGLADNDPDVTRDQGALMERSLYWNQLISGVAPSGLQENDNRTEPDSMKLDLTCQWGQGSPYNTLCPSLSPTERTVVGCTSTAGAQILYYWKQPHTGVGADSVFYNYRWRTTWDQEPLPIDPGIPENWAGGNRLDWSSGSGGRLWMNGDWDGGIYGTATRLSSSPGYLGALAALWSRMNQSSTRCYANFGTATYDWSLLEDMHYPPPSGAGDAEAAELSYHIAVSIRADFGVWGTGGLSYNLANSLEDHFRYDGDAVYGPRNLNNMVEDIQWLRPLILTGSDSSSAHAWVIAGYNKNTAPWQFYMNMGWNGNSDGWYSCDNIPQNFSYFQNNVTQIAPLNTVKFVGNTASGNGSPNSPYQNIEAALSGAPDNATLIFDACSINTFSAQTLTISRPMTLKGYDVVIRQQ